MGFTSYDYIGTSNDAVGNVVTFYEEPGLSTMAFTVGDTTYEDPFAVGDRYCWYSVLLTYTAHTVDVTYYAAGSIELTPSSTANYIGTYINDVDDSGIAGIGSYISGNGSNCFYESTGGADTYTPSLAGYTFAPTSEEATDGLGVLSFTASEAPSPPIKATNPSPADDATDEDFSGLQLSWDDGGDSDTYNVYVGETGDLTAVSAAQAGTTYTTTMAELETIFGTDPIEQKIYWRIDSTNDDGTTTGDEWDFDPRPAKASVPSPTNTATGTVLGLTATWTGSGIADTFDTYANVGTGLVIQSAGLESATWTPAPTIFDYITEYTWRVDSTNAFGTTTGDEWMFTTLRFDPPSIIYITPEGDHYQLLIQDDGTYGDPPGTGVENTDYVFLAAGYEFNAVATTRRLVAVAESKVWYEAL